MINRVYTDICMHFPPHGLNTGFLRLLQDLFGGEMYEKYFSPANLTWKPHKIWVPGQRVA